MKLERRHDAFTGKEILLATHRRNLVTPTPGTLPNVAQSACPFCVGHEAETEQTLLALPSEQGWKVRVVGNKYPLSANHEVVVETPDHDADLADYGEEHLRMLLSVLRERVETHEKNGSAFVSVFRNRGRRAGSSQPHPHMQIAALDLVPHDVRARARCAEEHHRVHGTNLLLDTIADARRDAVRTIEDCGAFVAFAPYAPHRSFETWIAPSGGGAFSKLDATGIAELARLLSRIAKRLRAATENADANLLVRLLPSSAATKPWDFWYLEFAPRFGTGLAGYELSTGMDVVTTMPEESARILRESSP